MCRFALYLGAELRLSALLTEPVNSIIHQSFDSHERSEPLNGDGFGIGWYPPEILGEPPALFKSTHPAWSNANLREIARVTSTRCLLAHVRAATPGSPVSELNCHPFRQGALTYMHNGDVGGFRAMRRQLLAGLSDTAFDSIAGTTDSEHVFAVLTDQLRRLERVDGGDETEWLAAGLEGTLAVLEALRLERSPQSHSLLNLVVCDGERAAVSRYASPGATPSSLYYATGRVYICDRGYCRMAQEGPDHTAVIIASEPLDKGDAWVRVPPGHLVLVSADLQVRTRPARLG